MRLDVFLVEKGFAKSREKAKHLIKEGVVSVNGNIVKKPSKDVTENSEVKVAEEFKFVSRGGYKLDKAVKHFKIDFNGRVIADVGCSVGGFTHYALMHGSRKVYSIDAGENLDESLRARVEYLPNKDAREIKTLKERIDLCLIDVTFSSIVEILAVVRNWLKADGRVLGLIKPQFEVSENPLKPIKVNDYSECIEAVNRVLDWASKNGYKVLGFTEAGLKGKSSKQQEFFIYLQKV